MFTVSGSIHMTLRKTDLAVDTDEAAVAWLNAQIVDAHNTMATRLCALGFSVESTGNQLAYETTEE